MGRRQGKSADLSDCALAAVRQRPAAVSLASALCPVSGARPISARRATFSDEEEDDGLVVTRIETADAKFNASTPIVDVTEAQGVN